MSEQTITQKTHQQQFDEEYVTAHEIMTTLNVSRTTILYARKEGYLPNPIILNDGRLFLWKREPIKPYLEAWKVILDARRSK